MAKPPDRYFLGWVMHNSSKTMDFTTLYWTNKTKIIKITYKAYIIEEQGLNYILRFISCSYDKNREIDIAADSLMQG